MRFRLKLWFIPKLCSVSVTVQHICIIQRKLICICMYMYVYTYKYFDIAYLFMFCIIVYSMRKIHRHEISIYVFRLLYTIIMLILLLVVMLSQMRSYSLYRVHMCGKRHMELFVANEINSLKDNIFIIVICRGKSNTNTHTHKQAVFH